jgi:large subunit ribosomal protein L15
MKLHELKPAKGARRERKRVGRGISSGQGKTSGRGQKGQGSRSSVNIPHGFEGGQMPISMRLPKLRGFHNRFKKNFAVVNLGKLNRYESGSQVDEESLLATGLVSKSRDGVKVLSSGGISVPVHLHVTAISARARQLVEKAGGTVTLLAPVVVEPEVEAATDVEPAPAVAPRRARARASAAAPVEATPETGDAAPVAEAEEAPATAAADAAETDAAAEDDTDDADA